MDDKFVSFDLGGDMKRIFMGRMECSLDHVELQRFWFFILDRFFFPVLGSCTTLFSLDSGSGLDHSPEAERIIHLRPFT